MNYIKYINDYEKKAGTEGKATRNFWLTENILRLKDPKDFRTRKDEVEVASRLLAERCRHKINWKRERYNKWG